MEDLHQRKRIIANVHDSSHLGVNRTLDMITAKYYWPGLTQDVKEYVSGLVNVVCIRCNTSTIYRCCCALIKPFMSGHIQNCLGPFLWKVPKEQPQAAESLWGSPSNSSTTQGLEPSRNGSDWTNAWDSSRKQVHCHSDRLFLEMGWGCTPARQNCSWHSQVHILSKFPNNIRTVHGMIN